MLEFPFLSLRERWPGSSLPGRRGSALLRVAWQLQRVPLSVAELAPNRAGAVHSPRAD